MKNDIVLAPQTAETDSLMEVFRASHSEAAPSDFYTFMTSPSSEREQFLTHNTIMT